MVKVHKLNNSEHKPSSESLSIYPHRLILQNPRMQYSDTCSLSSHSTRPTETITLFMISPTEKVRLHSKRNRFVSSTLHVYSKHIIWTFSFFAYFITKLRPHRLYLRTEVWVYKLVKHFEWCARQQPLSVSRHFLRISTEGQKKTRLRDMIRTRNLAIKYR